ncbi:hypothetical protein EK904_013371 [Melospiza melodia maxima]|nr:hypothetical protein EK904_013371 [Melospiza melodia maxima]
MFDVFMPRKEEEILTNNKFMECLNLRICSSTKFRLELGLSLSLECVWTLSPVHAYLLILF